VVCVARMAAAAADGYACASVNDSLKGTCHVIAAQIAYCTAGRRRWEVC
jgi:hypothetical protein